MPRAVVGPLRSAVLVLLGIIPFSAAPAAQQPMARESSAGPAAALRATALERLGEYRSRSGPVGTLALERLARAGDATARRELTDRSKEMAGDATAALLRLGDRTQVARAAELLSDRTLNDPIQLISALAEINATEGASSIAPWLNTPDDEIAAAAAIALGRLGHQGAAPELRRLLTGSRLLLRPAAAAALWRLGDRSVLPALQDALQNMLPEIRLYAARAWAPESDGSWTIVVQELLRDPHPPRRIAAGRLLSELAPVAVRGVLGRDMTSLADPALRAEAAGVFESVATSADTALLGEALGNDDAAVQIHAAGALVRLTGTQ